MKRLLDANACIRHLNGKYPRLSHRLLSFASQDIYVCSVVKGELFAGALKSTSPERTIAPQKEFFSNFVSLPFDDSAAAVYGGLRAELERAGTPIGPLDMQIAAIALSNNLILVTHNTREFSRVPGLIIEDWEV